MGVEQSKSSFLKSLLKQVMFLLVVIKLDIT